MEKLLTWSSDTGRPGGEGEVGPSGSLLLTEGGQGPSPQGMTFLYFILSRSSPEAKILSLVRQSS